MPTAASLTQEFNDPTGYLWDQYDAYQAIDRTNMAGQKHMDIRTFENTDTSYTLTMLDLSALTMTQLNSYTMTQLISAGFAVGGGEGWSGNGVATRLVGDGYVASLTLTGNVGNGAISASIINGLATSQPIAYVDMLTGFADDDHIVLSTPNLPAALDLSNSFLEFTSEPTGNFLAGPTAGIRMNSTIVATNVGGPTELRYLRSQANVNGIDLTKVTGVRLRCVLTSGATVKFLGGIRLLSKNWKYAGTDVDTRYGRLRRTVPRNGDITALKDFQIPILWRAGEPSGQDDPRPIDTEMGFVFNTGTISATNSFSMYFREVTEDFLTQLDLNGTTMKVLQGKSQPDTGTAMYNSRTQNDLEVFVQDELGDDDQFDLERAPDSVSASWIQVIMQWASGSSTITFTDTEGNGYSFSSGALSNNTSYFFKVRLEENSLRGILYTLNERGAVTGKVYDTTEVRDSFAFKRRKGRFGWYADLKDGGAWVDSLRERHTVYAEYRSLPLRSITPVDGAELFVGSSPNIELFSALGAGPFNSSKTLVERDSDRETSGSSWKITAGDTTPLQGVQSNVFLLSDFENSRLTFDLFYPSSATPFKAFLFSDDNMRWVELVVPNIDRDQWQSVVVDFPYDAVQTGVYKLVFLQTGSGVDPWWIDDVSMFTRAVTWDGRSVVDDPWKSNNAQWTPFHEIYNVENGGVLFPKRGSELQVRGRALTQFAEIDRVQFKPMYSKLGRIPLPPAAYGDKPPVGPMVTSYSTSSPGPALTTRFTGASTTGTSGFIAQWQWNFGDGAVGYGQIVDHTYGTAGTYTVRLVVTDNNGYQNAYTNTVVV